MLISWLARHKSFAATVTSSVVVGAIVAVAAVVSTGYTAQRLDLNDASVWVLNDSKQFVGRANTEVFELNTIVANSGTDAQVVQAGDTVLVVDRTNARLSVIDPATSKVTDTVALPPNRVSVYLAGSNVVVYSFTTGELWLTPLADLAKFDASQLPNFSFGANSPVSVDANGLLYGFSPEAAQVYRIDAAAGAVVDETSATHFDSSDDRFEITSVNGQWVVLDTVTGVLETSAGVTDIATESANGASGPFTLQAPVTTGDHVLVSTQGGMFSMRLGGRVSTVVSDRSGTVAAAQTVGDCEFAAWSDGTLWRACSGDPSEGELLPLTGMPASPQLAFQSNNGRVVLNDAITGATWAVQASGELINNWDELIAVLEDDAAVEENNSTDPPEIEQTQVPPVAVDDNYGARPGRATAIPVLINDYDSNGDILVVSNVDQIDPALGRIDVIHDGQQLQLSLVDGATGALAFDYTISDGRGATASATLTVTVRSDDENSPPQQVRATSLTTASGGQASHDVLGDWVDQDGDPFYLALASAASPDRASYKPDGQVVFSDNGGSAGSTKTVTLAVSDGKATGLGSLAVEVRADRQVPIEAEPFVVLAYSGVEVRIQPLRHVSGGAGAIRLSAVPPKSGVTITPNLERGTFRFRSDVVGTHYLDYEVTDGVETAMGRIRVDVAAPPDSNTAPIAVPKTVFVHSLSSRTVDIAATDIDPAGGVLLVTDVMDLVATSAVRAEVLEQRAVRITLKAPLSGPVMFGYRISNGLSSADGTITVIEIARPALTQPPIARDDTATARLGDAITIDVLSNDEQPDGEPIVLNPQLVRGLADEAGLLFVSGSKLRYLAPNTTGNFTATYQVIGPDGQTAEAEVAIQVREPNLETNHAASPSRIVARVLAGEQVRIDVPLDGIDPDGDSVQLLGLESNPEKGAVVELGSNYIVYEAGRYSAGTDTFTYTLIDALGARSTGTVRVGISPKLDGTRNPVAIEDEVRARPGSSVRIQVLANDSDPDGNTLTVVDVEATSDNVEVEILDDNVVRVTPPAAIGEYGALYTISNGHGGRSTNFIRVIVSDDAPLAYPVVEDTVLTLSDILDRDSIDVAVLDKVFFADGDASALGVSLLPGYSGVEVLSSKAIRVSVKNESQIIPFAVVRPDDENIRSLAFIWVPGLDDALPQVDRRAPALEVVSEQPLTIDLNDYVIAVGGKQVQLTDSSTVSATHSDGSSLVVDRDTLTFTSSDLYFGPASIAFEVTDGSSATDPDGRTAVLVLPITVDPRDNQPPDFTGALIEFEPGQEKVVDLVELTDYPAQDDLDELAYTVLNPQPTGFTYSLTGQQISITAATNAVKGSATSMTIAVRDAVTAGDPGRIELRVVPSTRPLARPSADFAVTQRAEQTVIDVLANDEVGNPFPTVPLRVVQVTGAEGTALPDGVSVAISEDNSRITASIAPTAQPGEVNLQYQVADATNDPDRYTWGIVRISIQDVPDAPAKPTRQANSFVNGQLTLRITPTQPNNSPVTNYRIISSSHGNYAHDCGTELLCEIPGLEVGALYSFQVIATNEIGDSAPSPFSDLYSIDYLPAAPASVGAVPTDPAEAPNGGSIDVSWTAVPDPSPGTSVIGYTVVVVGASSTNVAAGETAVTIGGLANDVVYSVQVYARNSAQVTAASDWNATATTVHTVGPPTPPNPAPQATSATNGDIEVSWGASGANGGSAVTYRVARVDGAGTPSDCTSVAPMTGNVVSPYIDSTAVDANTYTYFIYSSNGAYCTAASTGATMSLEAPGTASGTANIADRGTGQFDIRAGSLSASGTVFKYQFLLSSDPVWRDVPNDDWLTTFGGAGATYGLAIDVSFRACRNDSNNYCGDASGTTTVTPVNARVAAADCDATTSSPPFLTEPPNAGSVSVDYAISYNTPIVLGIDHWDNSFGSTPSDVVPSDAVGMRVKATVNGYEDPGFYEKACNH